MNQNFALDGQEATTESELPEEELNQQTTEEEQSSTMEDLLDDEGLGFDFPRQGDIRKGNVARVSDTEILVSIGTKSEGVIPAREIDQIDPEMREELTVGNEITVRARIIDDETGVDSAMIYYEDIWGELGSLTMNQVAGAHDAYGNGWYEVQLPYQDWKGIVTFFIWANDTEGNDNMTGLYDIFVLLTPYYVWGSIEYGDGSSVANPIIRVTNLDTNETTIAIGGSDGSYVVDLGTLYSGYVEGEELEIYATDGIKYGFN